MIVEGSDEGENGPNLAVGTHLEHRPQATPLNHRGKDLDTPKVEINLANNNGLLRPLSIRKGGEAPQQARACGIIELFILFKRNMLSMAPEASAGTSGEALGGKEKIETPRSREFEPDGVLLPGLTFEARRDAKSPFRSGIGWHMLVVVLDTIGFICNVSSSLVWMLRQAWEALQAFVAATPRVTETDPLGEAGCSRDGTTNLQLRRRAAHAIGRAGMCWLARRQLIGRRMMASRECAAVKIQLAQRKKPSLALEAKQHRTAAAQIQSAWGGYVARCRAEERRFAAMVRAALVVQRAGRLWLAIRVIRRRKDAARAISREAERALEELLESYRQRAPSGTLAGGPHAGLPPELTCLPPGPSERPPHKKQPPGLPPEARDNGSWWRPGLPPELPWFPPEPSEWPPSKEQLLGLPPEARVRNDSWWRSGLPPEDRQRAPRVTPSSWFLAGLPPELARPPPELFFVS